MREATVSTTDPRGRADGPTVHLVCKSPMPGWAFIVVFTVWSLGSLTLVLAPESSPIAFDPPFFPWFLLLIGLAGVGAGIWMSFWGHDRIELRDKEISLWRSGRKVKTHRVEQLAEVRESLGQTKVVFADGTSIRLNKTWKKVDELARTLRVLIDASRHVGVAESAGDAGRRDVAGGMQNLAASGGVAAHSRKVTLPRDYLDFGDRCFKCSRPAPVTVQLRRAGLIGYLTGRQDPTMSKGDVEVPVCKSCRAKRLTAQVFTFIGLMAAAILTIVVFASTEDRMSPVVGRGAWIGLMMVLFFVILFGGAAYWRGLADYTVLGVMVSKVSGKTGEVTLRFKDSAKAEATATRTLDKRRRVLAGAREFLDR